MHSLTVPSTRRTPSNDIWFWVSWLGWTWVSPDTRSPCSTVGSTVAGGGGGRTSIRQVAEQPSPLTVLPSSHCSPTSTERLPHTGSAAAPGPQFSVQVPLSVTSPEPDPEPAPEPWPISGTGLSTTGSGCRGALTISLCSFGLKSAGNVAATGPPRGAGSGGGGGRRARRLRPHLSRHREPPAALARPRPAGGRRRRRGGDGAGRSFADGCRPELDRSACRHPAVRDRPERRVPPTRRVLPAVR